MAREIDLENLTEEDVAYVEQRHWMIQEMEFQGVNWDELKQEQGFSDEDSDDEDDEEDESYDSKTVAELDDIIAERNEGRDEEDLISDEGLKADKVAALEADDAKS